MKAMISSIMFLIKFLIKIGIIIFIQILISMKAFSSQFAFGFLNESRGERFSQQIISLHSYSGISADYLFEQYSLGLEATKGELYTSGVSALMISTSRSSYWLTAGYYGISGWILSPYFRPYLKLGIGSSIDQAQTVFLNTSNQEISTNYFSGFFGAGLFLEIPALPYFYSELEARINFIENQDPQPCGSMILKLGLRF